MFSQGLVEFYQKQKCLKREIRTIIRGNSYKIAGFPYQIAKTWDRETVLPVEFTEGGAVVAVVTDLVDHFNTVEVKGIFIL